ncbi:MAG TPA: hypothetical protein VGI81_00510 [Tepidisphaeraceae bacterium]
MIRRLFAVASVVSLLATVAVAVLWVRSYRVADFFGRWTADDRTRIIVVVAEGRVQWSAATLDTPGRNADRRWHHYTNIYPVDWSTGPSPGMSRHFDRVGVIFESGRDRILPNERGTDANASSWVLPLWLAFPLTLPVAAAGAIAMARSRQRVARRGLCPTCGYDLRASTDRCPERGTPIPATS